MTDTAGLHCRGCHARSLEPVLDLGPQPAASTYPTRDELASPEPRWPLRAWICTSCWLLQLDDDGPDEGAGGQVALPAWSGVMEDHARGFASAMAAWLEDSSAARRGNPPRILETASHGNYLQPFFLALGVPTVIAEGSTAWADAADRGGLLVERRPLSRAHSADLERRLGGRADGIVDYYLLAHLRDPGAFLAGVRSALGPNGVAAIELDHVLPVLAERQFDAIRHGHFSYLSLLSLRAALARAGLRLVHVDRFTVYGGALRAWVADASTCVAHPGEGIAEVLADERRAGLDRVETYRAYRDAVAHSQAAIRAFLEEVRSDGRLVAGYGAPSRGNTLLNSSGITDALLPFTVDRSPDKQGHYLPGSHVPIHAPSHLAETRPDFVLILTWDLAAEVQAQLPEVRAWGGRFVVPIPEVTILP